MEHIPRRKVWLGLGAILALGFLYLVAKTLNATPQGFATSDSLTAMEPVPAQAEMQAAKPPAPDDIHQIGHLLFTTYVAPFEVTSLLVLVATIGVIVLCKQDQPRTGAPVKPLPPGLIPGREPARSTVR